MKENVKIAIPDLGFTPTYKAALISAAEELGLNVTVDMIGRDEKGGEEPFLEPAGFRAEDYDGLLLPGGADVEPKHYGEEDSGVCWTHPGLDELQTEFLAAVVKAEKPVLGICRGHQLIHVYFKGSLYQDIEVKEKHRWISEDEDNAHEVIAQPGSLLFDLYGGEFRVNSSHHQAVKHLGEGLIITAKAPDGTVEAIEHETLPIRGVQFHPERMCYGRRREDAVDGSLILKRFLLKASE